MNHGLRALRSVFELKSSSKSNNNTQNDLNESIELEENESPQKNNFLPLAVFTSLPEKSFTTPTGTKECLHKMESLQSPISPMNGQSSDSNPTYRVRLRLNPRSSSRKNVTSTADEEEEETVSEGGFEEDEQIIFEAIKNQDYEALVDYLNDDQIDANEMTSEGRRYLHECVTYDDQEACDIVLDAGAQINARDIYGWTGLHFAAAFNLGSMVQYLLNRGADPRKKTKEGEKPEDLADSPEIVTMLQVAKTRRGLRSVSTVSISDIEQAKEEFERRQRGRKVQNKHEEGETSR